MKHRNLKGVWTSGKAKKELDRLNREDVKSIAVIRHAALGDMVLTRNFLLEAKKLFPQAKITLSVVSHYMRGIPEDIIDRLHILDSEVKTKMLSFIFTGIRENSENTI